MDRGLLGQVCEQAVAGNLVLAAAGCKLQHVRIGLGDTTGEVSSRVAVASIFIGMICGLIAYFMIPDDNINYFVGNVFSLCVPIVVIMIGSLFEKEHFDFEQLNYLF